MAYLFVVLGVASIGYFAAIINYAGLASKFHIFWLLLGIGLLVAAAVCIYVQKNEVHVPRMAKRTVLSVVVVAFGVFALLEIKIIAGASHIPSQNADYLIVLGCRVRGDQISRALRYRLDEAVSYLEQNANTKVIVSGGQGAGENLSEAAAMKEYLCSNGIAETKIIEEDVSSSTLENIRFSIEKMQEQNANVGEISVVIVSSDFHVARGVGIAKKQGLRKAEPLAAKSDRLLVLSQYVREAFAMAKDIVKGNM